MQMASVVVKEQSCTAMFLNMRLELLPPVVPNSPSVRRVYRRTCLRGSCGSALEHLSIFFY
jgi:hypothetical protein